MKKIFWLLSLLVALGLATNSCISEMVPEPAPPEEPGTEPGVPVKKTFYMRFNTDQFEDVTTYAYPNMNLAGTSAIVWGESENAGVFMMGNDNATLYANRKYYLNIDNTAAGRRSAYMVDTITTATVNATCYGYYPHQTNVTGTNVSFRLNSVQNQSADDSSVNYMDLDVSENLFLLSPPSNSFEINQGSCVMNFQTIFSVLRFQVTKSADYATFNSQKIKKVELYIADKSALNTPLNYNLAGDFTIDVSRAIGTANYQGPVFATGAGSNKITATVTGGNNITEFTSSSPYVWFVVNPVSIKSNECLVSIIETDDYKIIDTCAITALRSNNVYAFNVQVKSSNTISDKIIVTHYPDDMASNCYVISRAGLCQIPLNTVNGVSLQGNSVDWLWASKEHGGAGFDIKELIDPASIKLNLTENCIQFRVGTDFGTYTKGNVILALKDANGNVVWSWHIWITDDLRDYPHEAGVMFLDRNIGALSAQMGASPIDNFGFVYQWGRKDPFFGGDGRSNETTTDAMSLARANTIVNTGVVWPVPSVTIRTADYARQNPMLFVCNNTASTNLDVPVDWISGSVASRWAEHSKTDNDPCPQGYRVPNVEELKILHDAAKEVNEDLRYFKLTGLWHWKYYYYWGSITTEWPSAGMRQGRYYYNGTSGAKLLNSGTDAAFGKCYYWTSTPFNTNGSFLIYTSGNILYDEWYGDNADACPIRCIEE